MQNTKKIPTLLELKNKVSEENTEFDDDFVLDEEITISILELVEKRWELRKFLLKNDFEEYELSTVFFSQLKYYLENLFDLSDFVNIQIIFKDISDFQERKNPELSNVIYTWLLEHISKDFYDKIWTCIPKNTRQVLYKYHEDYSYREENLWHKYKT